MFKVKVIILSMACYAVTGGNNCMKTLVDGEWESYGDCSENQELFKSVVDEIRAKAEIENGMTTENMMTSESEMTSMKGMTSESGLTTENRVTQDDEAVSQLQKFLSTKVGDNDISIMTNIQMEYVTLEGSFATNTAGSDDVTSVTSMQTEQTITEITKTEAATTNSLLEGWEKAGRTYYKCFNDRKMTYVQAKANCTGYNGRLAAETLRDPVATRNISSHCLKSASTECLWIGYDDIIKEGQWIWSDGGATTNPTTQWADNQPDNYTGTEDCACIVQKFHKGLFINDNPCEAELNFVCEVPRK